MAGPTTITGVPAFANPGEMIRASLAPAVETTTVTEIVNRAVSFDFIAKQVVFSNKNYAPPGSTVPTDSWIEDSNVAKILPLFNLLTVPPSADSSGVPGLIGTVNGTIPMTVQTDVLPTLAVEWTVTDEAGNTLSNHDHFEAPGGLSGPTLDIMFAPEFERFDGTVPPPVTRTIKARVTITAGGVSETRDLPPVSVLLPKLPFPKVLALTVHADFQGPALVVVPDGSGVVSIEHIRTLLQPIRNAIAPLSAIARFVDLLAGIDTLTGILNATRIEFRKRNQLPELDLITFDPGGWFGVGRLTAEDSLSAFVYLSPPPPPTPAGGMPSVENTVEMLNARNLSTSEGRLTLATGRSHVALCRSLNAPRPAVAPPDASLVPGPNPSGWNWWHAHSITTFGDELSSLAFL